MPRGLVAGREDTAGADGAKSASTCRPPSTFHELCLTLGREAGTLPPEPADKSQEWWDEILPRALDGTLAVVGGRYHAIVVDEGQDFARGWLDSLYLMLTDAEHDVLYVFHDPEQALYREDVVASLGPPRAGHRSGRRVAAQLAGFDFLPLPGKCGCRP